MDASSSQKLNLNWDTIPQKTAKALKFLSGEEWLGKSGWYLAGGTALALQAGHRVSVDLDFFTTEKKFDVMNLRSKLPDNNDWRATLEEDGTLYGELFGAKVSFISYPFFIRKQDYIRYGNINILQPTDIAVMKIIAISQRGKKRDFFDLYWCVKNIEPLETIIRRLPEQYPSVAHDYHHILKSIVYFADAETDATVQVSFDADWLRVKKFFTAEVPIIAKKLMNLT